MKILVTGKNGFIAQNVIEYFSKQGHDIYKISHNQDIRLLEDYCDTCDFIFHLAAVQRTENEELFYEGNVLYTENLLNCLVKKKNHVPIIFTTSTGIDQASCFSKTKIKAEELIRDFGEKYLSPVYIFKLNHIFGKYGKPNFNNVVSTFCYNYAKNIPLQVSDPAVKINITYINDLLSDFDYFVQKQPFSKYDYIYPTSIYKLSLGELIHKLGNINENENEELVEKLKSTYEYYKTNE